MSCTDTESLLKIANLMEVTQVKDLHRHELQAQAKELHRHELQTQATDLHRHELLTVFT